MLGAGYAVVKNATCAADRLGYPPMQRGHASTSILRVPLTFYPSDQFDQSG
jgi:hypothetical protein